MTRQLWRLCIIITVQGILPVLRTERVDVDGSVRGLCGDELVKRIPRYTLNIMAMLCNLPDKISWNQVRINIRRS